MIGSSSSSRLKRAVLLVVAGTAAALAMSASASAAVTTNTSIPLSLVTFIPCGNGGFGDSVFLTGNLHVLVTFTSNGNTFSGLAHFQPQGVTGNSSTTGAKYEGTGVTEDTFSGSFQRSHATETFVNNFRLIGQGSADNYLVHEVVHLTFDAAGTLTAAVDNSSVDCR